VAPLDARGFRAHPHAEHRARIGDLRRESWWRRDHGWLTLLCDTGHLSNIPVPCGVRYCDICAGAVAGRRRKILEHEIQETLDGAHRSWRVKMLTLTIENHEDLAGIWDLLLEAFDRLREMVVWTDARVAWWRASLEVTTSGREWHPHLHIVMCSGFMKQEKVSGSWISATRGWGMIVDIREIYGEAGREAKEAAKYLAKPDQVATWSRRQRIEFSRAARSRQTWFGSGKIRGIAAIPRHSGCRHCGSGVDMVRSTDGDTWHHYRQWIDEIPD